MKPTSEQNLPEQKPTEKKLSEEEEKMKKIKERFQSVSIKEYYDSAGLSTLLMKGLEELAKQRFSKLFYIWIKNFKKRPQNPCQFLGKYLIENDPAKGT